MNIRSWCWQEKGEPENLLLKEIGLRKLQADEVLVQNTFIGLNPVDWKLIAEGHPLWKKEHVPGVDGAGIVVRCGEGMLRIPEGLRVCYHGDLSENGSFSTHTILKGDRLIAIPDNVSDAAAAAFPCPGLTAWQAFQKIPCVRNKNILVNSAGGSVGYFIVQLLLAHGARVFVTASQKHHEAFYRMGVVKALDYKSQEWVEDMKHNLFGNSLDVIFDTVSGKSAKNLMSLLGYYGHIVSIQDRIDYNPLPAFNTCISIHEIALGAFHKFATDKQIAKLMSEGQILLNEIGTGILKQRSLLIDDFEHLNTWLQQMKNNHSSDKYVIRVS